MSFPSEMLYKTSKNFSINVSYRLHIPSIRLNMVRILKDEDPVVSLV